MDEWIDGWMDGWINRCHQFNEMVKLLDLMLNKRTPTVVWIIPSIRGKLEQNSTTETVRAHVSFLLKL